MAVSLRMEKLFRAMLLVGIAVIAGSVLPGCAKWDGWGKTSDPSARLISTEELAADCSLRITRSSGAMATLKNSANTVKIHAAPDGTVFVNGQQIAQSFNILAAEHTLYLPRDVVEAIRKALRPEVRAVTRPRLADIRPKPKPQIKPKPKPVKPPKPKAVKRRPKVSGVVVLDAGHGGRDPGAVAGRYREKDIVLKVTLDVARLLAARGVTIKLTRSSDVTVSLDERAMLTNRVKPNLFVSIHADAASRRSAKGFSVFYPKRTKRGGRSYLASRAVAANIGQFATSRGVRQHSKNLRVLEQTRCSAMLIELGFMSNRSELSKLVTRKYQKRLANAIADAITEHLEVSHK